MAKLLRMSDYAGSAGSAGSGIQDDGECGTAETPDMAMRLRMNDILGRDYGRLEDMVYGILRIREILDRHVGPSPEWQRLLLDLLRESCRAKRPGPFKRSGRAGRGGRGLVQSLSAVRRIQHYIEGRIEERNALELGSAVVILKLIEHTPVARSLLRAPASESS
ncbi:hypothetical protein V6C53_06000 [Desulfocurvibacter africanus]|uniref:Uncharacterized protein n=2 Tax=Desulfocurvibacter africanus TaxID=873 RepID=F3YTW4_DESAF|nr:hypothetical protein [Desulfocurvibacter africanus]EGJ48495.1 hypothetical protein Desaf_0135 [Desulfocurvibacter africanus subsp. africanus str. Walvis Bay]EMG37829.1 hypothetical protein PCS_01222 [Desulfocurvibacter africanus PCS]